MRAMLKRMESNAKRWNEMRDFYLFHVRYLYLSAFEYRSIRMNERNIYVCIWMRMGERAFVHHLTCVPNDGANISRVHTRISTYTRYLNDERTHIRQWGTKAHKKNVKETKQYFQPDEVNMACCVHRTQRVWRRNFSACLGWNVWSELASTSKTEWQTYDLSILHLRALLHISYERCIYDNEWQCGSKSTSVPINRHVIFIFIFFFLSAFIATWYDCRLILLIECGWFAAIHEARMQWIPMKNEV